MAKDMAFATSRLYKEMRQLKHYVPYMVCSKEKETHILYK